MKKKVIMLSCIAAVAIASFVGTKTFESNAYENGLLALNVEALTQNDLGDLGGDTGSSVGYSHMHIPCYKNVYYGSMGWILQPTGQCSATCWQNPNSDRPCHSHSCSDCCSGGY